MPVNNLQHNTAEEAIKLPSWATRPSLAVQALVSTSFMLLWLITELASQRFLTQDAVSGWYPTAGLGIALLWALGLRYAWVIVPAAVLGGMAVWGHPFLPSLLLGFVKGPTYAGAAWVLRRAISPGALPRRPIDVGVMIAAMLGCASATAAACVGLLVATRRLPAEAAGDAIIGWAVGDAIGILVTAPLIVLVLLPRACQATSRHNEKSNEHYARIVGNDEVFTRAMPWVMILLTTAGLAVLSCLPDVCDPRVYYLGFIALPAIAMRYRLAGGLIGLLSVSFFGMLAVTLHGIDMPTLTDMQLIMIALSICTVLVGSFAVMRGATELRRQAEQRWATLAIRGSGMGRWHWEVGSTQFTTDYLLSDSFGYRRDKVLPTVSWWQQRIHPEDVALNEREIERLLIGKTDYFEVENRMLAADGTWGWFHSQGTVIERDARGKPRLVAGTHQDITERKELERIRADAEATHRSEQRFRTLADGAPVAIFQTDAKGVFLYVNPAWCRMTGQDANDALYRGAAAFAHEQDRNDVADHWAAAAQSAAPVAFEHRVVTPDGRTIWLQTQATPMQHNGVLLGYVGTGVDVTPYRQAMAMIRDSEARYRTLADHAYDMLWRVSADAVFTYVSPSVTKLMGYRPEEMVSTDAFSYFHPDDIERVRGKHAALAPDSPEFLDVHRYRRKDGSYIVFEAVGRLIQPDDTDDAPYIAGISRDVTQRVESERIQRELEEKLQRSQKLDAIGTFATGIAHDFRNSLLAIKASAQSVGRNLDPDHAAQGALATVNDACAQAMAVTQSLLTFAKGHGASKRKTDLTKLIHDNARLLQAVLPPGIDMAFDCTEPRIDVQANAGEIQQALLNLVVNAKDAIGEQGRVRITLDQHEGHARLAVSDDGCGMSSEELGRALEPFYTTKARLKGTGLGLAQVHGIVSDHGGEVTLASGPGQGTTVTLTLPLIETTEHVTPPQPQTEAASP